MTENLRNRASKNFEKYLKNFQETGETTGLPHERLTDQEWKQLNEELKNLGVELVPHKQDGYLYYWFARHENLRNRASKNFEKYLKKFQETGETIGLPHARLTDQEWKQLNEELKNLGVELVPHKQDGYLYYWFTRLQKSTKFKEGKEEIENRLIEDISKKYPGVSKITILEILRSKEPITEDTVYERIRHKQDGQYTDVLPKDFEQAFYYAITSAHNGLDIANHSTFHKWSSVSKFISKYGIPYFINKHWPKDRYITMSGTQHWTWFRECSGSGRLRPVQDKNNPNGFHISLNVNVVEGLLKVLDNILIEDGGSYIDSYKFPKTNYYDEILTRHDPVTIYMRARNPELEQKIVKAVAPFVRSNDGMIGELLGKGVCINPETSNEYGGISVGETISRDIVKMIRESNYRS